MCGEQIGAVRTSARSSSLPRLVGNSGRSGLGRMPRSASRRGSRPARSAFLCRAFTRVDTSSSVPGTHGTRSARSGALRFCNVTRAAQPRAAQPAAGTALLPKRGAARNRDQRVCHKTSCVSSINGRNLRCAKQQQRFPTGLAGGQFFSSCTSPTGRAAQLGSCTRPRAVRWPGACGASVQRDALRRAVGTKRHAAG
jgi:hypothetical protein